MGSQVTAICECGIRKSILIGGGMATFTYLEYFPFLCDECGDVVEGNLKQNMYKKIDLKSFSANTKVEKLIEIPLKERKFTCPKCNGRNVIPYNDSRIIGNLGDGIVARSFDNVLTDGNYKCPKCSKMTLKFLQSLYMWD